MLNDSQQLTVRVAIRRARENGTEAEEIKKLATGMHISEAEIRACTDSALGTAPAKRRVVWTSEMVERLTVLHDQGMGPAAIAKKMGMKPSQVQFKLSSLKLKTQEPKNPEPAVAPAPLAGEPLPANPPEEPAEPKGHAAGSIVQKSETEPELVPDPAEDSSAVPASSEPDPEYDAVREKLAAPEPAGIDLAREQLDLIDHFKLAHNAQIRLIQASPLDGWTSCNFEAYGVQYTFSLRKRKEVLGLDCGI